MVHFSGNFEDSYRNVSYKHLMAHKWTAAEAESSCRAPVLVLKADDDVFVEIFHLG